MRSGKHESKKLVSIFLTASMCYPTVLNSTTTFADGITFDETEYAQPLTSQPPLTFATKSGGTDGIVTVVVDKNAELCNLTIPSKVDDKPIVGVKQSAFKGCNNLRGMLNLNSVTAIGNSAFEACLSLEKIVIGAPIVGIGNAAFCSCHRLKEIEGLAKVTAVGADAFTQCHQLAGLTFGSGLTTIGASAFSHCYGLMSVDLSIVTSGCAIGSSAFEGCDGLQKVEFEKSDTEIIIDPIAFKDCWKLTEVVRNGRSGVTADKFGPQTIVV
ncbi:MAG: leucine-rich repeat domain-containing protein [Oscillospiraceae bacterium]|nr:leucine-rich repeat domain-containing protein [Oscillospiraceae bacterium]